MISTLLLLLAIGWWIEHASAPYLRIALATLVYCAWRLYRSSSTWARILWANVAVVTLVLGVAELVLWRTVDSYGWFDPIANPRFGYVSHPDYGYGPLAPSRTRSVKLHDSGRIYDVIYTIDQHGLRVSPPERAASGRRGCVLFLGCSVTFGEGVEDDQTMPWQVGVKTDGRFAIRNLAYQGWGPHQMLSALESGHAERAARCDVTHVVYFALYWHALRSAGRVPWGLHGPRYVLDEAGRAVRAGYLSSAEASGWLSRGALDRLGKSQVFTKYLAHRFDPFAKPITPRDLDLLAAIVARSREEVAARFPRASFHVLFWDIDLPAEWIRDFESRVASPELTMHRASAALPDFRVPQDPRYTLSRFDRHPSPAAHAKIADYVVREVLHYAP
jgi:hypothetical protein